MLYIAELNTRINLELSDEQLNIVTTDYYNQPHARATSHALPNEICYFMSHVPFDSDGVASVRTGLRCGKGFVSYTSSAGNVAIIFDGHNEEGYTVTRIALSGRRHGLVNPVRVLSDLLGVELDKVEQYNLYTVSRAPTANPYWSVDDESVVVHDKDTVVINDDYDDDWYCKTVNELVYEVAAYVDSDDMSDILYTWTPDNTTINAHIKNWLKRQSLFLCSDEMLNQFDINATTMLKQLGEVNRLHVDVDGLTVWCYEAAYPRNSNVEFIGKIYRSTTTEWVLYKYQNGTVKLEVVNI